MAKKVNNVVIGNEELTPTTIGIYNNKTKNPIGIILLVIVFISIVFFLPDIQSYVNKFLGKEESNNTNYTNKENENNNNNKTVEPDENDNSQYDILQQSSVDTDEYKLSEIALNNGIFTFTFFNKSNTGFDLSSYYLEFFSNEGTFINRIKIGEDIITSNNSKTYAYNVSSNVSKFTFVKKTPNDYPSVKLNYNENMEATLTCRKATTSYNYLFVDDKLSKVTYIYELASSDSNYISKLQEYENNSFNSNLIDGISAVLIKNENGLTYTMNVDLQKADLSKLQNDNLFAFKKEPKEVKFIEEAKGFICSQN